ncbi:MAG: hypothetical protein ACK518_01755 [bacterium]|jgi:archaellum component FlaC
MFEWINQNFVFLSTIGTVLSGGIGWILGGRQEKNQQLKKGDVEIETAEIDYAVKVRELYESLLNQAQEDKANLKADKELIVAEFKEEKEYFRTQVESLRSQLLQMQGQFNDIQIAYAREVEMSQNWEKLHRELTEKYNALEKDHEELKSLYSKLKNDFELHKKKAR